MMQALGDAAIHRTKNGANHYTTARTIVLNATGYYSWPPSDTQMKEIAELTYSQDFNEIMEILREGLINPGFNYGQISRRLTVLNYCLKEGSENVAIYFRNSINAIKDLREFQYFDDSGEDQGAIVRQKAINICNLLQDERLLRVVRRVHTQTRNHATHGSDSEDIDSYTISKILVNGSIPSNVVWDSKRPTNSLDLIEVKPLNPTSSLPKIPEEACIPKNSTDEIKALEISSESEFEFRLLRSLESVPRRDTGFETENEAQDPEHCLYMLSMLCRLLVDAVLGDKARNQKLLEYQGKDAQMVLNLMQMLLGCSPLEAKTRRALLIALRKLSRMSQLYPQCFTLRGVTREVNPIMVHRYNEIFKGAYRGQLICLKVVKLHRKPHIESLLKACSKEAIFWGHLSHPNLLPFYGIYRLDNNTGQICLVAPWMINGNITEHLTRNPHVPRFLLVRDTAAVLLYLHKNDIVHGGLKGKNILITSSGRACITDRMVNTYGNVRWQAPELISSVLKSQSTEASDIYAFASVCYEIFTGMIPFYDIVRSAAVKLHVMSGARPPPPEITLRAKNGLTDSVWQLMEECWKTDPSGRPTIQIISARLSMGGPMVDDRSVDGEEALPSLEFRKVMHSAADHFSYEDLRDISTWLPDL